MTPHQTERGTPRYGLRDLAWAGGLAVLGFAGCVLTPLGGLLAAWTAQPWAASVLAACALGGLVAVGVRSRRAVRTPAVPASSSEARPPMPTPPGPLAAIPAHDPHPVVDVGPDGAVRYVNPAARRIFPGLADDPRSHPFLCDVPAVVAELAAAGEAGVVREVTVGDAVYEQHVIPSPENGGAFVYGVDITERKQAARALQESEAMFVRVFRSAPMPMAISRLADGRFIDVNDSFVQLLGYAKRGDVIGRNGVDVGLWTQSRERALMLERLSDDRTAVRSLETRVCRRDGTMRDVLLSVVLMDFNDQTCVLAGLLDVTENKQAEAGLAILKSFYENTLKELPIQVAVFDADGNVFYQNPQAVPDEELRLWMVGKSPVDYAEALELDPAPYRRRHEWLLSVVATKTIGRLEEVLTDAAGGARHLLRVATPVLNDEGEVIYVVSYGMDITERKLFEQKLMEAKDAAEEMARLKSSFVANMSHEIRTPLTAIMGFASVLGEELQGEQRELVDIIKQSGERLLETLNSVLDLARAEANAIEVDPRPLELTEELRAVTRLFRPMAQNKGLAFEMDIPIHELRVQLDRACLHRILSNLLSNAIKFTDEGGLRLSLKPLGREVQIQVADTGIGIDAAFLPHLFEEFKQESSGLARTHTGSGLGLAITRHLVERMHGRIEVESEKGRGTTFTVTFPAMNARPAGRVEAVDTLDVSTLS